MAYTLVVLPQPQWLQPKSYNAIDLRKWFGDLFYPGVVGSGSFLTTFSSGLSVSVAAGVAYVKGQNIADQGMYREYKSTATTIAVGAGHATLPRLDQIILRIMDNTSDASGFNEARIEVVPGTATSGATLDNRTGAADLTTLTDASKSVLLLADVLVPAAAGSINSGAVRDKRVFAGRYGDEIVRVTKTTDTSITATTSATANTIVDAGNIEFDGNPVEAIYVGPGSASNLNGNRLNIGLFEGSTLIAIIAWNANENRLVHNSRHRFTPTAGRHNYLLKGWMSAGTGTVYGGTGTAGAAIPTSLAFERR